MKIEVNVSFVTCRTLANVSEFLEEGMEIRRKLIYLDNGLNLAFDRQLYSKIHYLLLNVLHISWGCSGSSGRGVLKIIHCAV